MAGFPACATVYISNRIAIVILIAPLLAAQLRLPPLVVLIVSGTILGSNVTGVIARDVQLILLEKIGLLYIMLLAGLQMNLSNFRRLGVRALVFGLLTFGIPLTTGTISGTWLTGGLLSSILLGILYSPHTLVSYLIVTRLGIVQHEAIAVAIGGTMFNAIILLHKTYTIVHITVQY